MWWLVGESVPSEIDCTFFRNRMADRAMCLCSLDELIPLLEKGLKSSR